MRESVEFRIQEKYAARFLEPQQGKHLGDSIRSLEVAVDDPLYERINDLNQQIHREDGHFLYYGWRIHRRYSQVELESAEVLHLRASAVFEPAGELCGTIYDNSTACSYCGAGRRQVSELILDLRRIPKNRDIARTIADEWVISQRLAQIMLDAKIPGFELRPVHHKARYEDDPIDLKKVPAGREILRLAAKSGVPHPTWEFWVWFNRPEQAELAQRASEEHAILLESHARRRFKPIPVWYQLMITSARVPSMAPTRFGIDPFDEDVEGRYRCPLGHVSGLNILSEISASRAAWDVSDIAITKDLIGSRRGLLVPAPLLLISARLWHLLEENEIRGYDVDVAHLV